VRLPLPPRSKETLIASGRRDALRPMLETRESKGSLSTVGLIVWFVDERHHPVTRGTLCCYQIHTRAATISILSESPGPDSSVFLKMEET
jgi:hypothetical protein